MTKDILTSYWLYLQQEVLPLCEKPAEVLIEIVKDEHTQKKETNEFGEGICLRGKLPPIKRSSTTTPTNISLPIPIKKAKKVSRLG